MKIEHRIQVDIVDKLASSAERATYTQLKPDDIENSLFSYHLNKLITQKMVEKDGDGYSLTTEGARWLNDNGQVIKPKESPRVFVALVIKDKSGDYLIGQRTGQYKSTINDYLLPSLNYQNNNDVEQQIDTVIKEYIPEGRLVERTEYGFAQLKASYSDRDMRALFSITHCLTDEFEPVQPSSATNYSWVKPEELSKLDHPSAAIIRAALDYISDSRHEHYTPLFKG